MGVNRWGGWAWSRHENTAGAETRIFRELLTWNSRKIEEKIRWKFDGDDCYTRWRIPRIGSNPGEPVHHSIICQIESKFSLCVCDFICTVLCVCDFDCGNVYKSKLAVQLSGFHWAKQSNMSQNFVCTKFWVNYFVCLCDAEFERYGQKGHLPYILEITALCNIYGKAQSTIFYGHEGTGKHKYFNQNWCSISFLAKTCQSLSPLVGNRWPS